MLARVPEASRRSELAEALTALERRHTSEAPSPARPTHLPVCAIKRLPEVFQPRQESEAHLSDLRRALKVNAELEPMLVLRIGAEDVFLIDGHHRFTAYRAERVTKPVPVTFFEGSVREAVIAAGLANHRAKLVMTTPERMNRAWLLVVAGGFSKSQIAAGSGVAVSQVAAMRKAAKAMGDEAADHTTWWKARQAAQGKGGAAEFDDEERERWLAAQAASLTERLGKTFGTKLSKDPEVTARAFASYFGRRLPDLVRHLRDHVSDDDWSGAEDEEESEF